MTCIILSKGGGIVFTKIMCSLAYEKCGMAGVGMFKMQWLVFGVVAVLLLVFFGGNGPFYGTRRQDYLLDVE